MSFFSNIEKIVEGRQLEDIIEEDVEENEGETFVKVIR